MILASKRLGFAIVLLSMASCSSGQENFINTVNNLAGIFEASAGAIRSEAVGPGSTSTLLFSSLKQYSDAAFEIRFCTPDLPSIDVFSSLKQALINAPEYILQDLIKNQTSISQPVDLERYLAILVQDAVYPVTKEHKNDICNAITKAAEALGHKLSNYESNELLDRFIVI
ncbi:uncharacterized protein VICG_02200, partial [Vittaforma corneae ATCC 50505]